MVLLHVKQQKDERQFLFEATGTRSVDSLIKELVVVNNLQVRVLSLKEEGKALASFGPMKPPRDEDDDDEDSDDEDSSQSKKRKGLHYNRDPSGRRTGESECFL